jgi:RimJ/RimL family protein N-acetyltransferase
MSVTVRQLNSADAAAYKALRLASLVAEPIAFGSDPQTETAFADTVWVERLQRFATFGAFDGDTLVGIASVRGETAIKTAHRAHITGVYVRPQWQGKGAGNALFETLIAACREKFMQLHLVCAAPNERARRFYERFGFVVYGHDPRGLFVDGAYINDLLMVLRLDEGSTESETNE